MYNIEAVMIVVLITYQMYEFVVRKQDNKKLNRIIRNSIIAMLIASVIVSIILVSIGAYGNANLWCWISPSNGPVRVIYVLFVIIMWVAVLLMLKEVNANFKLSIIVVMCLYYYYYYYYYHHHHQYVHYCDYCGFYICYR